MLYLGIDPGMSGGLAVIDNNGSHIELITTAMPKTERDIYTWVGDYCAQFGCKGIIEKVGGYIGSPQPGSAMFKFGASYGGLRMALIAADIPFDEVTPQRWQRALGITPRNKEKESKSQFKNRLRAKAQQFFPKAKVTLAVADAILIAEFCRRTTIGAC